MRVSLDIEQAIRSGDQPQPISVVDFGRALRALRQEAGWTAAVLASLAGCTTRQLHRIEGCRDAPPNPDEARHARRAAVAVGIDPVRLTEQYGFTIDYTNLEELTVLNPAWIALVTELNELKQSRPSWWE